MGKMSFIYKYVHACNIIQSPDIWKNTRKLRREYYKLLDYFIQGQHYVGRTRT